MRMKRTIMMITEIIISTGNKMSDDEEDYNDKKNKSLTEIIISTGNKMSS